MTTRQTLLWTVFALVVVTSALTGILGCGGSSPQVSPESPGGTTDKPLVRSDVGVSMSTGELLSFLNTHHYKLSGGIVTADTVRRVVDSLLIDTLTGLSARDIDLSKHRLPYRDFIHQYQDALIRKWTDVEIRSKVSAYDSAEVLTFFNANPQRFSAKEQLKVLQILISGYGLLVGPDSAYYKAFTNAELREMAKEKIFQVYDLLKFGEAFENLALVFNQDVTTRDNAGMVGWVTRGTYINPFDSVAFGLKVGEFSRPYLDKDGWHIVKVDGHLPEGQLPIDTPGVFEYARQTLLGDRLVERAQKVADSLRQGLKLELNPAIADSNIYRVNDETWGGVINGIDTVRAYVLKYYEEGMKSKHQVDSSDAAMKLEMLGLAADRYLAIRAVETRGLDRDTDVVNFREGLWFSKCKQIVLNGQYDFDWTPSDTALREYYDAHINEYELGKPTTLQYMTIGDSTFAAFLRDQAITGLDLSQIAEDFASTNPGGVLKVSEIMTVGATDVPFEIWQRSVVTAPGGVSATFKHDGNYVFVKVLSRRESRNFALAKGEILVKLQKEHQRRVYENFRDNLYKKHGVKIVGKIEAVNLQPYWVRNKKS